ncbi:MAG: hypothetical protein ACHQK8_08725, partial [Bacteroidia bacterium]
MKNKFCFLLLLLSFNSFAQQPKDIYLGVNFSVDRSPSGFSSKPASTGIEYLPLSYTAGITALFQRTKHFGFQTGVNFKDALTQGSYSWPASWGDFVYSYTPAGTNNFRNHVRLLEVPLKASFNFGKGKLKFIAGAGLVAGFILNCYSLNDVTYVNGSTKQQSSYTDNYSGEQRRYLNFIFSAGMSYLL